MKFNLSEKGIKIWNYDDKKRTNCPLDGISGFLEKDVKEFIKELKKGIFEVETIKERMDFIDKLAGPKLITNERGLKR